MDMERNIEMNLHDLNKAVIAQLPALNSGRLKDLISEIEKMVKDESKYFMLLSHENRDYTVFAFANGGNEEVFADEVISVLESRGKIKEYDVKRDSNAIEIWVEDTFYVLFPYDLGVIEI